MKTRNIPFNDQECQVAISLFDIAIKADGLNVAHNALALAGKLKRALAQLTNEENGQETLEGPSDKPETDTDADGSGSDHPAGGAG